MSGEDYKGSAFCGVDAKQRFTLPVEFRHRVREGSNGNSLCLHMGDERPYLLGFGEDYVQEIKAEITADGQAARARGEAFDRLEHGRINAGDIETVTFDDGGRFALPDDIRNEMGIADCLFFIGNIWAFEVWAPQIFLDSGQGSRMSRMRCRSELDKWLASPKNPNRPA